MNKKIHIVALAARLIFALTCVCTLTAGVVSGLQQHTFASGYFVTALTAFLSLLLVHVPDIVKRLDLVPIPWPIQLFYTLFVLGAMLFGEILRFYDRFAWWDTMLHFSSGILFSMIGYLVFLSLNRKLEVRQQINPITTVLFSVCFAIAAGAVWEIFEFSCDSLLGINMQRWQTAMSPEGWMALKNASNLSNPGLIDTMKDVIVDVGGALLSIAILLPVAKIGTQYSKTDIPIDTLHTEAMGAAAGLHFGRVPALEKIPNNNMEVQEEGKSQVAMSTADDRLVS